MIVPRSESSIFIPLRKFRRRIGVSCNETFREHQKTSILNDWSDQIDYFFSERFISSNIDARYLLHLFFSEKYWFIVICILLLIRHLTLRFYIGSSKVSAIKSKICIMIRWNIIFFCICIRVLHRPTSAFLKQIVIMNHTSDIFLGNLIIAQVVLWSESFEISINSIFWFDEKCAIPRICSSIVRLKS